MIPAGVSEQTVADQFFRESISPPQERGFPDIRSLPNSINRTAAAPELQENEGSILVVHEWQT